MRQQHEHGSFVTRVRVAALVAATLVGVTSPHAVSAASFDCKLAKTFAEKTICSDPALSQLDDELASSYQHESQSPQTYPTLRADQHHWLVERAACNSGACLTSVYQTRIAQLQTPTPLHARRCTANVLSDAPAIEDPTAVLKRGAAWGPVTQVKVNKKTGAMAYCAHGDYCYPATGIEVSACSIDAKPDGTDDDEWIYTPS